MIALFELYPWIPFSACVLMLAGAFALAAFGWKLFWEAMS